MSQCAVVNYSSDPGSVELRELEKPTPGPNDVKKRLLIENY